jgi:hypothetical protein
MPNCSELKTGDSYVCDDCGLEIQVTNQSSFAAAAGPAACGSFTTDAPNSVFACCGQDMVKNTPVKN